jgi:IPT/TIG domain
LYGETAAGGSSGIGEFYSFDVGLEPFVTFLPAAGVVGRTVDILGQGFTGTTEVSFNGTPATFKVSSDTYLTAIVSQGSHQWLYDGNDAKRQAEKQQEIPGHAVVQGIARITPSRLWRAALPFVAGLS